MNETLSRLKGGQGKCFRSTMQTLGIVSNVDIVKVNLIVSSPDSILQCRLLERLKRGQNKFTCFVSAMQSFGDWENFPILMRTFGSTTTNVHWLIEVFNLLACSRPRRDSRSVNNTRGFAEPLRVLNVSLMVLS